MDEGFGRRAFQAQIHVTQGSTETNIQRVYHNEKGENPRTTSAARIPLLMLTAGSPYPDNPTPAALTMPDFATLPEGFGRGEDATNRPVYLAVLEEWAECTVSAQL